MLETLPGKVSSVRNVIIDGILRVGSTLWRETEIQFLELLRNPDIDLTTQSNILNGLE